VRFRAADVRYPDTTELLAEIHREDRITGRVVDVSQGPGPGVAAVRVRACSRTVVVPLACLERLDADLPALIDLPRASAPSASSVPPFSPTDTA
jgi:hypothetical protein